ncbi:hypothetical protein HY991_05785 [Candidatus Micrarchaeota archaeon]|nr:hypothetical protein [Candidatus Micrarchaeota archaeon]
MTKGTSSMVNFLLFPRLTSGKNHFLGNELSVLKPIVRDSPDLFMGAHGPEKIVKLILDAIPEEGVTVHKIVYRTGLDHRTVKKYLELMIAIQKTKAIVKEQAGLITRFKLS